MAKADILDRVAADLAVGHTHPAIQRLASLVADHPTDLDLRSRLAAAYRSTGNSVEAGRWDYLSPLADPADLSAFERAFPRPAARLRELRWPPTGGHPATEFARQRLTALLAAVPQAGPTGRRRATTTGLLLAGTLAALLAVVGAITVAQWIVG